MRLITEKDYLELTQIKREHKKLLKITNNIAEFYNKIQDDINNYNICVNSFDLKTVKYFFEEFKSALIKDISPDEIQTEEELLK